MLDHVIVTVSDFTRSIAFYAQALRMTATKLPDIPL
jgi:catechol 2,3-dioxygenase-like lactoylglutathione lyase family enzyme